MVTWIKNLKHRINVWQCNMVPQSNIAIGYDIKSYYYNMYQELAKAKIYILNFNFQAAQLQLYPAFIRISGCAWTFLWERTQKSKTESKRVWVGMEVILTLHSNTLAGGTSNQKRPGRIKSG